MNMISRNGKSITGPRQEARRTKAGAAEVITEVVKRAMDKAEAVDATEMAKRAGRPVSTSGLPLAGWPPPLSMFVVRLIR